MAISSPGVGSNLDVNGIVSQLMAIERQPLTKLNTKEASYQTKLSAIGSLKGVLSTLQGAVGALTKPATFAGSYKASSSDSTSVTASANDKASIGNFSVSVEQLAQAQKLRTSSTFSGVGSILGSGEITIQFGTTTPDPLDPDPEQLTLPATFTPNGDKAATTITIDPAKNTLLDVRDAINKAGAGVTATLVNDGSGFRLAISSNDPGAANSLKITVDDDDGDDANAFGLSALAFDPTTAAPRNVLVSQEAKNALLTVDGIPIVKSTNTITDAIEGVTLNLLKEGGASNVAVSFDRSAIATSVQGFVKAYNEANKALREMGAYDPETKAAGPLQGDSVLRTVQYQLRAALRGDLSFAAGGLRNLAEIGLSFSKDGTMIVDQGKLNAAINDPAKDVATLFTAVGKASDSGIAVSSTTTRLQAGRYDVNISQLATRGFASSAVLGTTVTTGLDDAFSVTVDGVTASVTLAPGVYTGNAFAAEIQSKVNGHSSFKAAGVSLIAGYSFATAGAAAADLAAINAMVAADSFDVTINGTTKSVTVDAGGNYANAGELAEDLQARINAAFAAEGYTVAVATDNAGVLTVRGVEANGPVTIGTAAPSPNVFDSLFGAAANGASGVATLVFTSASYGSSSKVTGVTSALLAGATSNDGVDVAGRIGGADGVGKGRQLTAEGAADGLVLTVNSGRVGDRGVVSYEKGFAQRLNDMLAQIVASDGVIASKTKGIQTSVKGLDQQREVLARRLEQVEARYRKQFNALDTMMAKMTQTSNYLTQQLGRLSATTST